MMHRAFFTFYSQSIHVNLKTDRREKMTLKIHNLIGVACDRDEYEEVRQKKYSFDMRGIWN
jgi:hypothetical protein